MKILALIFSLYTLMISGLPCADLKVNSVAATTVISSTTESQEQQPHNEGCSPLCSCTCCSALGNYNPMTNLNNAEIVFSTEKHPFCNATFCSRNFSAIWQPPRF